MLKSTSAFLDPTNLKTSPPCIPYNQQETAEYLRARKEQTSPASRTTEVKGWNKDGSLANKTFRAFTSTAFSPNLVISVV